jgi:hypothetical protein
MSQIPPTNDLPQLIIEEHVCRAGGGAGEGLLHPNGGAVLQEEEGAGGGGRGLRLVGQVRLMCGGWGDN